MFAITFGSALILSLILVPAMRAAGLRFGRVAKPRDDRWHRKPTPTLGGVAIYAASLVAILVSAGWAGTVAELPWGILAGATFVFFLGLYDDFKRIAPPTKLIGQILAATIVISTGYTTNFFTPRIDNPYLAQVPNILLTYLWLVGITNAINLLDNMDGLAAGISLITALVMGFFFWQSGNTSSLVICMALAGALLGFLFFNFPPASIFMGDSGSLYLGFSLAALAIARQPQASNVFAVLGVPTLIFLLPILDTLLVTITRLLRGQSPAQGGRDHTSHRLIAFGLSERQAVLALYGVAIVSGLVALGVETLDYWLSLILVPLLVIVLALATAYLARLKVVSAPPKARTGTLSRFMLELTYRQKLFEIVLDVVVIGTTFYLAFLTYYGFSINAAVLEQFLDALPLAFAASYLSFFVFGVYRGVWIYIGLGDLINYFKATVGSVALLMAAVVLIYSLSEYPPTIFLFFGIYLFLGLAATRSSFRILDRAQLRRVHPSEQRVLIYGADNAGEVAVRWIQMNPQLGYEAVAFFDNDPFKIGRQIHGVNILGGHDQLESVIDSREINGVVLSTVNDQADPEIEHVIAVCHARGCWVRALRMDFELIE
jgi:UDP-GlcNAc:undecaprenyl-phosphate GlcNAc-1-phosphate transferase